MPKGRGFLGCSQRTRHATPKGERCDRLTRALVAWLSPPLHRRRFPQALRYVDSLAHGEPERHSSPALKGGVFWRRKIISPRSPSTRHSQQPPSPARYARLPPPQRQARRPFGSQFVRLTAKGRTFPTIRGTLLVCSAAEHMSWQTCA